VLISTFLLQWGEIAQSQRLS